MMIYWVIGLLAGGVPLGFLLFFAVVIGHTVATSTGGLADQCDSAVGSDPSHTVAPTSATVARQPAARPSSPASTPSTNPYAELTIAPGDPAASDWLVACLDAMQTAPVQGDPLQYLDDGFAGACARNQALAQLASSVGENGGGSGGRVGAATLTRAVIYHASVAALTGRCESIVSYAVDAGGAGGSAAGGTAGQQSSVHSRSCGPETVGTAVIVLPNTAAAQLVCGKRVDPVAISAGDLVFWEFGDKGPTQVGIAVEATQMVTADPVSGTLVQRLIPTTGEVRVKRVLESAR
ncbi:hypothetical protein [Nocardia sp. NBC_00403]|uniref:hypothetical protein n=1 Tax=Nocardia sp. NBC_00403 TaxID=2975990 RepID=UPI002E22B41F